MVSEDALDKRIRRIVQEEKTKVPDAEKVEIEVPKPDKPKPTPAPPKPYICGVCNAAYEKPVEKCEECGAKLNWD